MHPVENKPGVVPVLSWTSVGELAGNEYYHVTFQIRRQNGPVVLWMGLDTAATTLTVSETDAIFMRTPPQVAEVTWYVTVLAQAGDTWTPGGQGVPVSRDSLSRVFLMLP